MYASLNDLATIEYDCGTFSWSVTQAGSRHILHFLPSLEFHVGFQRVPRVMLQTSDVIRLKAAVQLAKPVLSKWLHATCDFFC
jgi:hypothetical protein